jgi:ATP-dependent RNA helicase DHX29
MERRYSKTLPRLDLDPALVDRILSLVVEADLAEGRKPLEEPEDKAIGKLGITYGVLRRIGFTEERVDECLRAIRGVDLDEAYDWVWTFPFKSCQFLFHCSSICIAPKRNSKTKVRAAALPAH